MFHVISLFILKPCLTVTLLIVTIVEYTEENLEN